MNVWLVLARDAAAHFPDSARRGQIMDTRDERASPDRKSVSDQPRLAMSLNTTGIGYKELLTKQN